MHNSKCKHCLDGRFNEIGEKLYFCELWAEWRNYTLGDCIGNCECEETEILKMEGITMDVREKLVELLQSKYDHCI